MSLKKLNRIVRNLYIFGSISYLIGGIIAIITREWYSLIFCLFGLFLVMIGLFLSISEELAK